MNYLAEIRHFYDWLETESLPSNAIVLWHALMFTANRCGWREEFSVPFSVLENRTKLDKSTISACGAFWSSGALSLSAASEDDVVPSIG